jgi:orotidine-5'-phosphate decarboxylase
MAQKVRPHIGAIKLGLEFFIANGRSGVKRMDDLHLPVFLDLKFHDIPNTVARAIEATAGINTFMMTVHTAGGHGMMRAAIDASMEVAQTTGKARPFIVGVTMLTSLDQNDLSMIGIRETVSDQVKRLADLAQSAGLDGVVCSPYEIPLIRQACGNDFLLVVPGVRPKGFAQGDQKRTMTPEEAVKRGADYVVIGRPITQADNPGEAAENIAKTIL